MKDNWSKLTEHQKRFASSLAKTRDYEETAKELGISMRQVFRYRRNILDRIVKKVKGEPNMRQTKDPYGDHFEQEKIERKLHDKCGY